MALINKFDTNRSIQPGILSYFLRIAFNIITIHF